ncbi:MAG TPA: methyltransferase, partial [Bacteroidia bacterium]|nr:methyltransferase [Bacteroidia bacterium]
STGPVVSFRAVEHLHRIYSNGTKHLVPLYQLHNTAKMKFTWPLEKKEKPQYIVQSEKTKSLLLPNKDYIFLRRFSAKDDKSRLVATPYFSESVDEAFIGVENHLNYIYRPGGELSKIEIIGLTALLNSSLFDRYFRTFNGNINVSATELKEMPFPPIGEIKAIGSALIDADKYDMDSVNEIINEFFDLEKIYG